MFNTLPEELIINIIEKFPCRTLYFIKNVNRKLKDIVIKHDLMNKAKMQGYPRKGGHCYEFNIEYGDKTERLTLTLDYLYQQNADLVRGDLIAFEMINRPSKVHIFDGCRIINLEDNPHPVESTSLIIPKEFNTITNDIPLNYWENDENYCGLVGYYCYIHDDNRSYYYRDVVWLGISKIRDQLLKNVNSTGTKSRFVYNEIEYVIEIGMNNIDDYKLFISNNDMIKFNYYRGNILTR